MWCMGAQHAAQICDTVVDDYIPCNPGSGGPAFSCGKERTTWMPLIEKAWAKLYGSYGAIDLVGDCGRTLEDLTGTAHP